MKNRFLLAWMLVVPAICCHAQIQAITDTGEEVLLYEDGTWKYKESPAVETKEISVNEKQFTKDEQSTFLVNSNKLDVGIWINPQKWSFEKAPENEDVEFYFTRKGEDLYGMLIAEKLEIPIESLRNIALQNAKNAAPDMRIIREEYRNVNGNNVLMMQMQGTVQGIKFTYYGYYYSSANGSVQFLTYTSQNLFEGYEGDMQELLNGFAEL